MIADVRWLMRAVLDHEKPLIAYLVASAGLTVDFSELRASPMNDGGMGSLLFDAVSEGPRRAKYVAKCYFNDDDGIPVSAALNLDQHGHLYELDIWKVDYNPLNRWPTAAEIRDAP